MIGMNAKDAQIALEDVVIINAIHAGARARGEATTLEEQAVLLRKCTQRIREQMAIIDNLREQLAATQQELDAQREKNNDMVAVSNATALALKDAVQEIQKLSTEPQEEVEHQFQKKVRTRHYNNQVNKLLEQGWLKKDPRITDVVDRRPWYIKGMDPDHGL